jgi:hypothetical protein
MFSINFKTIALAALTGTHLTTALPTPADDPNALPAPGPDDKFQILVIAPNSPIQNTLIQAVRGSLWVDAHQDATCPSAPAGIPIAAATFYIKDSQLFLYNPDTTVAQQVAINLGGMVQGQTNYYSDSQKPGRNTVTQGFRIDADLGLVFTEQLLAGPQDLKPNVCDPRGPSYNDAGHSVAFGRGDATSINGAEGCREVHFRPIKVQDPEPCVYSPLQGAVAR